MPKRDLTRLREEYINPPLLEKDMSEDPVEQFSLWYDTVQQFNLPVPNAMVLATADKNCRPSARVVLLKSFSPEGFVFFTNYNSRKGHELSVNPYACLLFYWDEVFRQVIIEGKVEKIAERESDAYFETRPRGSQISAVISPQSQVIPDRDFLLNRYAEIGKQYAGKPIPRPENWGGYLLTPHRFEFWQGQENRLHDRIAYEKTASGVWKMFRLAP